MSEEARTAPPSLAGADWLLAPGVRRVFAALDRDGDEARIVGGAVRDALAGRAVGDIDFATTATPDVVQARAAEAGLKVVPTGIEHGTLTLVADGVGYQVTTLREDIETDGRRAVVRFGRDWEADARRRDFTVNALSVDAAGVVRDPVGGYSDIVAGRIGFIGDADQRIAEDRLRILRFFRLNAEFGSEPYDSEGLSAAIRAREGLRELSAERIGQEMRRLILAPRATEAISLMQDCGILPVILAGVAFLGPLRRCLDFERAVGAEPSVALRLAATGCRVEEDAERIGDRLRLPNAERGLMRAAVGAARRAPSPQRRQGGATLPLRNRQGRVPRGGGARLRLVRRQRRIGLCRALPPAGALAAAALSSRRARRARRGRGPRPRRWCTPQEHRSLVDRGGLRAQRRRPPFTAPADDCGDAVAFRRMLAALPNSTRFGRWLSARDGLADASGEGWRCY